MFYQTSRNMMARLRPRNPLVAIIGATGTGKSQLAVDIAKRFNGEVINADAVQMYSGLPIITNKLTDEEQNGVPHHLLGCINLDEPPWTVGKFVRNASRIIEEIQGRGKLAIVVGGTHYYIQALLFPGSLLDGEHAEERLDILQEPTEVLIEKLREVDPVMAARWHPGDRRKIQRSLEIYLTTGRKASEIYDEQKTINDKPSTIGMNYEALIFWPYATRAVLRSRLDARVLRMVDSGLLDEINSLESQRQQLEESNDFDESKGIWVSIGYKEFAEYRNALSAGAASAVDLKRLRNDAIERTQAGTRQYAKRQLRWIQSKLLSAFARSNSSEFVFLLDGSDLSEWEKNVSQTACRVTEQFLEGEPLPNPKGLSVEAESMLSSRKEDMSYTKEQWQRMTCEMCEVTAVTATQWDQHLQSNRHRKALSAIAKRQRTGAKMGLKHIADPEASMSAYPNISGAGSTNETRDGGALDFDAR